MHGNSNIAIIAARGGSKRIPRKNIRAFLGKPIMAYSIEAALQSGLFSEVMVSTDDAEIAEVALELGAIVPFMRSKENANDFATTADVLFEVLEQYRLRGQHFETACCIYPTAPFVDAALLHLAYSRLTEGDFDCVFPILPFSFPIQRALKIDGMNQIAMFHPEHMTTRSQDLEKAYHDSGQFYMFRTEALLRERKLYMARTSGLVLSEMQAHDIDHEEDWKVAEFKFSLLKSSYA